MADRDLPDDDTLSIDFPDLDELDEYGVWVKSGTEDLAEGDSAQAPNRTDDEGEGFLSEEEESLLGDLEVSDQESLEDSPPLHHLEAEEDPMSDTDNKDNLEQEEEFSIEIPDIDDEAAPITLSDDDDDLQSQLDNLDLDSLDEGGELSISLDQEDDEGDETFLEENELHLDLDEDIDNVMLDDFSQSDEEDVNDLVIPGFDEFDEGDTQDKEAMDSIEIPDSDDEDLTAPVADTGSPEQSGDVSRNNPSVPDSDDDLGFGDMEEISLDNPELDDLSSSAESMETESSDLNFDTLEDSSEELDIQEPNLSDLPDLEDDFLDIGDESIDLEAYEKDQQTAAAPTAEADSTEDSMELGDLDDFDSEGSEMQEEPMPGIDDGEIGIDDIHEPDYTETLPELDDFDDVEAFADDLVDEMSAETTDSEPQIAVIGGESSAAAPKPESSVNVEAGSSILAAIEHELSAIKSELTGLRQELRTLREQEAALKDSISAAKESQAATPPALEAEDAEDFAGLSPEDASTQTAEDEAEADPDGGGGFFDDDEDETIALTGDELDNILNTAEFTEEAGQPTEYEEDSFEPDGLLEASGQISLDESTQESEAPGADLDEPELEIEAQAEPIASVQPTQDSAADGHVTEISLEEVESAPSDHADPFKGSDDEVRAMAEMDIEKELEGIEDLEDESLQFDFDEEELEKMSIEIPDSFSDDSSVKVLPDGYEPDLSKEESDILQEEISEEYQESFPEDTQLEPEESEEPEPKVDEPTESPAPPSATDPALSASLKDEIKSVLAYMDKLLEALPEEKIEEFARSEHFEVYKRLFEELGL